MEQELISYNNNRTSSTYVFLYSFFSTHKNMGKIQAGSTMAPRHHKAAPCEGLHSQRTWLTNWLPARPTPIGTWTIGCCISYIDDSCSNMYRQIVHNISQYENIYCNEKKNIYIYKCRILLEKRLKVHCFIGCGGVAALN